MDNKRGDKSGIGACGAFGMGRERDEGRNARNKHDGDVERKPAVFLKYGFDFTWKDNKRGNYKQRYFLAIQDKDFDKSYRYDIHCNGFGAFGNNHSDFIGANRIDGGTDGELCCTAEVSICI